MRIGYAKGSMEYKVIFDFGLLKKVILCVYP